MVEQVITADSDVGTKGHVFEIPLKRIKKVSDDVMLGYSKVDEAVQDITAYLLNGAELRIIYDERKEHPDRSAVWCIDPQYPFESKVRGFLDDNHLLSTLRVLLGRKEGTQAAKSLLIPTGKPLILKTAN